jgi:hypothetical protein
MQELILYSPGQIDRDIDTRLRAWNIDKKILATNSAGTT